MNRMKARTLAWKMLAAGAKKQQTIEELVQQGVRARLATFLVAAYPTPDRIAKNRIHAWGLIAIVWIEAFIPLFTLHTLGAGTDIWLAVGLALALVGGTLTHGFVRNRAEMYSTFILVNISFIAWPLLSSLSTLPSEWVNLAIAVPTVIYTGFLMVRLFPDLLRRQADSLGWFID